MMETITRTYAYPETRVLYPTALTSVGALHVRNVCLGDVPKSCYIFDFAEGWTAYNLWRFDSALTVLV
jgi:hypothetical protein